MTPAPKGLGKKGRSALSKLSIIAGGTATLLFGSNANAAVIKSTSCDFGPAGGTCFGFQPPVFGDKVISNFFLTPPITADVSGNIQYSWNDTDGVADADYSDDSWIFQVAAQPALQTNTTIGPIVYGYDVAINDTKWQFDQVGLESNVGGLYRTTTVTKVTSVDGVPVSELTSVNGKPVGDETYTFANGVTKISIADTFTLQSAGVFGASLSSITNSWTQRPSSKVPGPLPLLGVGAAFGMSRRIRSRVRLSRQAS